VHAAAKCGVFAYVVEGTPDELQSAINITLRRFAEYQSLQGAFGRRALIEQAKGILMARDTITADTLRSSDSATTPRKTVRKLSDVAAAVIESHLLLVPAQP
jgi:AmiR/NasT family two-component response regulator